MVCEIAHFGYSVGMSFIQITRWISVTMRKLSPIHSCSYDKSPSTSSASLSQFHSRDADQSASVTPNTESLNSDKYVQENYWRYFKISLCRICTTQAHLSSSGLDNVVLWQDFVIWIKNRFLNDHIEFYIFRFFTGVLLCLQCVSKLFLYSVRLRELAKDLSEFILSWGRIA